MKKKAKKPIAKRRRSAIDGKFTKGGKASEVVEEQVERVLWRGWTILRDDGTPLVLGDGPPLLFATKAGAKRSTFSGKGETVVRVKLVKDKR